MASHTPHEDDSNDDPTTAVDQMDEQTDKARPAYVPDPVPTPPLPLHGEAPESQSQPSPVPSGLLSGEESTEPVEPPLRIDDQTLIRAPMPSEGPFAVEVVAGPIAGKVVPVGRMPMVLGRALGALQVDDPFVSEAHASFFVRNGEPVVADGGAPSGVFVEVAKRVALAEGDVFACGLQVFRFLGAVEPTIADHVYGAPLPFKAYRLEHVLVGGRSGRIVVFRHSASIGRTEGSLQFPDDVMLDDLHVELKVGPHGMALVTHSQRWPAFMRIPAGAEIALEVGTLVRVGTSTLRVITR